MLRKCLTAVIGAGALACGGDAFTPACTWEPNGAVVCTDGGLHTAALGQDGAAGDDVTNDSGDATARNDAGADVVDAREELTEGDDAGDADAADADGCSIVQHSDGFGHTFQDCIPIGVYDEQLAHDACISQCDIINSPTQCAPSSCALACSGDAVMFQYGGNAFYEWYFKGPNKGTVGNSGTGQPCTAPVGTWQ